MQEKAVSEQRAPSVDEPDTEKKRESTDVSLEPVSAEAAAAEEERELDPVALNKSFRIAAWASVLLVRSLSSNELCVLKAAFTF